MSVKNTSKLAVFSVYSFITIYVLWSAHLFTLLKKNTTTTTINK